MNYAELDLLPHPAGTVLPVRVQPSAKRDELRGVQNGRLKVAVIQPPEKGKANKAVIELLSKRLRVPRGQIELVRGETSREKQFLVRGLERGELLSRLGEAAAG